MKKLFATFLCCLSLNVLPACESCYLQIMDHYNVYNNLAESETENDFYKGAKHATAVCLISLFKIHPEYNQWRNIYVSIPNV